MLKEQKNSTTKITRQRMLSVALIAAVIVYLLWNVEELSFFAYPFRLFVTYVHEAGHSIMALLTGGEIIKFSVSSNGAGLAITSGGARYLILPAGYLGAAFFGAALFYLLNTRPYVRTISIIMGIMLIVFTLMYAGLDPNGEPTAMLVGLLFGAGLIGMGWKLEQNINLLLLNVLAIMTASNAILDIKYLTRTRSVNDAMCSRADGIAINDAAAFTCDVAREIPPIIWAFLWMGIALGMIGAAVYYSTLRPILDDVKVSRSE